MEKKKNIKNKRRRKGEEKTISRFFASPEAMKKEASSKKLFFDWKTPKDIERAEAGETPEKKFQFAFAQKRRMEFEKMKSDVKKQPLRGAPSSGRFVSFLFGILKSFYLILFFSAKIIKNLSAKALEKYKELCEKIKPKFLPQFFRRHFPLFLAIVFLAPALVLLFLFVNYRLHRQVTFAADFTGKVKVSKQSTTLSNSNGWYTAMAYSGDGVNGDAETGTFNPIHPGGGAGTEPGAGSIAYGHAALGAMTTFAASQFIGFQTDDDTDLVGVLLAFENLTSTSLSNSDIVVELLRFPNTTCTTSCTPYPTGAFGAYVYPTGADMVVERRTVWQFNKGLSGENAAPGQFGRATFDFRFDTPIHVGQDAANTHYGIRVINMSNAAPATTAFGAWAEVGQDAYKFPAKKGTLRRIGVDDIDNTDASTMIMPLALTANSVTGGSAALLGGMVIGNSLGGVGMPTARRTENSHWKATYSAGEWTIASSPPGSETWTPQTRKLTTATDGGTGASWVDDQAAMTTLTQNSDTSNRLCVASIEGFAANQYIDIWDSDTAPVQRQIASTSTQAGLCPGNGPSIVTTAVNVAGYTVGVPSGVNKNATVARSIWKQRIIQGAVQLLQKDTDASAVVCVSDSAKFTDGGTVAIWDDNSIIITRTISSHAGSCTSGQPLTLSSSPGAAAYTTSQYAYIAEVSATLSNTAPPSSGAVMRWTSFNYAQNPAGSALLARTSSVSVAYAKNTSPSLSGTRYPFLSNRHLFFAAYGDEAVPTAPVDGDMIIVGNGKTDPDSGDSTNLENDINWASKEAHTVTIDRSWNAPMAYSGTYAAAVGNGAGTLANFTGWSQNGGWVSALVTPGSQLGLDNSANKHYRITIPGKIVVDSDASVALGKTGAAIPASSGHDIYFDTVGPPASTLLTGADVAGNATTLYVTSATGFMVGDTIVLDDSNSIPTARVIAAIESSTQITLVAGGAATPVYSPANNAAFIAKGPTTELPTGTDRRAGIYTMTGLNAAATPAQSNIRTGRIGLYADGSEDFRTEKSDLAVDIDGNIDTGYLGNNLTDSGNTWVDVEDDVVGDWQALDQISVAGGTNQLADNDFSSTGMGGTDDLNQMPVWTGAAPVKVDAGAGGRNALPTPNMEVAEIGTIPMTDIYNADYNLGVGTTFSPNYANVSNWTIFNDGANTEVNDAVYFGDQGSNMPYALEFNLGTALNASASYVWEYYKSGVGWTEFTPRDAYQYQTRTGVTLPLSADTVNNSLTATVAEGGTVFGLDQIVMIDDSDSDPIYRRLGTAAPTATTLTFSEPIPSGYTVLNGATVTRLNGGQWQSMDPTQIFTSGTGRRIISWTPSDLNGTPAKTPMNGIDAFWVRAKISSFTSWTASPTNQTTPVGMGGIEKMSSGVFNVSSGVQEAKVSEITPGSSFDPNENYILEYGNSPGWTQISPVLPAAPYTWHINSTGMLSQNTATTDFHAANGDLSWENYTVTAKVRLRTAPDTASRKMGIVLRNTLDGNGYAALIETDTDLSPQDSRIGIYPMTLGAEGTAFVNATTKAVTQNTWYWIKANVSGTGASTQINAKFWEDGTGEPGWETTFTTSAAQGLWNTGRIGLFADAQITDFDDVSVDNGSVVLSDSFTNTGTWKLRGSVNGDLGTVTPGTPFASNYLNFTLKQKGGWNGVVNPEIGDKIYISPTSTRSYKGLSGTGTSAITTSDANTVYENVDFEWDPDSNEYNVTGSATGAMGTATPGSAYSATGGKIGLTIPSGAPTATKFGDRMLLLQDNLRRNTGSWIGSNGLGSAALVWPSYALTSSAISPRYNIEGQSGTATARQRGTIDFWFKTNYSGAPSSATHPKGMYLFDQANQGNSERLFIRHTPDGYLEAGIFAAGVQNTLLRKQFSAAIGEWNHFRLAWNDSDAGGAIVNKKKAWLNGTAFTAGEGQDTAIGARGANAGIIRIGNAWTYDAPFDGAIDEFAIFDDAIDTSSPACDWGTFTPPGAWTGGQTAGCDDTDSDLGTNIFRASFDQDTNPQEGSIMADYAFGMPSIVFTNGADTGNERIRVVTYPERTRVWVDNTGEKYTPSARIKAGSGYEENAALATLTGWSHNYMYHHKAARQSEDSPTYSPVLNLKRSTHIWSVEPITQTGATMGAPINAGMGYAMGTIGLSGLGTINFSDVSMENQYTNFAILTNPFTSLLAKPAQTIANSVFYNFYDRAYTVTSKTEGTNYVGADFVTTHFAAANIGSGYNASLSQNVGLDGSIFMGNRNAYVTVPPVAANGAASFFSGRLYRVNNSEFYNNGVTGAGTSGALNFTSGVAKVDVNDNIFSINTNGIRLFGNSFFNMSDNIFEGHVADDVATIGTAYGSGIRVAQTSSSVAIADNSSIFGRGLWNEADINTPPNTGTFEAESLIQFTGDKTQFLSPVLFGTADYANMSRIPEHYFVKTIPGADIRGNYSSNVKDIVNFTTFGNMCTTCPNLADEEVRTDGGYGWRMEPTSSDVSLDYSAKLVGVAGKPLAAAGYIRLNSNYGSSDLPTVTLSGLGMTGVNLTWTAEPTADEWQQFVVSGTPTESALAELKLSVKNNFVVSASGTSELISNATGNYLPVIMEDNDASWTTNQWVGYKMKDANGKIFDIVRNTDKLLYLKGMLVPHLLSVTFAPLTPGDYIIYNEPYVYLDDVSVLSGTVDTGTLDFHSQGQPVSPWLATGLTAEGVWNAQWSTFANSAGSFGQLLGDALVAKYANVSDPSPSATEFDTNLDSTTDDFYNNGVIAFTEGPNKGVVRRISDYTGASKTITVDPALPFAPSDDNRFAIIAATASASGSGGGATAAEIWGYISRTLTGATLDSGSLATQADIQALNNLSAQQVWEYGTRTVTGGSVNLADATEVWDAACAGLTESGSVGKKVCDNLDAAVSSRSTLTAADVWAETTRTITGLENPALAALANSVWNNATRELTSYGNDITAQNVWDVLTSSLITIDSIGKMLVTNVDTTVSSRASQSSVDSLAVAVAALNDISAADVWTYATRTITGDVALTSDSRKAIWDTACTILNTSGSVGKLVCDNLDAEISSRSTLTAADVWGYVTRTITGLEDPALAALANSVWNNATRELTSYGNDITAQNVWDVLTSSLTTIDSIGKLLVVNVDETISSRASQESVDAMSANLATILSEIGTGNISAIKTKTDTISWSDITGLVTTSGEIKLKTDTINWTDIGAIKTATDTIDWSDITAIKLKTNTINWGDITDIKSNVATLLSEIGVGNISAIKAGTDTIKWSDITGLVTTSGQIKTKTDTIDWNNITAIKTKTDTISWDDVTGVKLKTDTINWSDVSDIKTNVSDIEANVDVPVSTRASQDSMDTHESAESAFRTDTTSTLSDISSDVDTLSINVAAIQGDLSAVETKIDAITSTLNLIDAKIDTVGTNVDSIKTTVETTSVNVAAIQTVTNNILNKWGDYSAADIVGYIDALENYVGDPDDESDKETLFGRIKQVKESVGSGGTIDLIYAQVQTTHDKLLEIQAELGFSGKSTDAYDEIMAVKTYVDSLENSLATLDSRTSNISSSVSNVSNDLKDITNKIGRVSSDSLAQNLEVKKTDIDYLKNKIVELKAVADINRQLLEQTINQPIVKVLMEWGSVVIKFIIVNPSDSTDQKIPFKAYLPKEVKQEYIMDLGGLSLNYDATTEQYYVTADIALKVGESVTRMVEIKDIWIISEDEINSTRKQAEEMAAGLNNTSYNAQAITLKTDINTRLDKIARKQKDSNATPQDHILAFRENQEELKAVQENMKGIKDLVLNSGTGKNLLASIGGIQTFATWGIVLALIFGMGALGFFYYALWRKRIVAARNVGKSGRSKVENAVPSPGKSVESPTPLPWRLPGFNFAWVKKIFLGIAVLIRDLFMFAAGVLKKIATAFASLPSKALLAVSLIIIVSAAAFSFWKYEARKKEIQKEEESKPSISSLPVSEVENPPVEEPNEKEKRVFEIVAEIDSKAEDKAKASQEIEDMMKEGSAPAEAVSDNETENQSDGAAEESSGDEAEKQSDEASKEKKLTVKETPTGWLNVREEPSTNGALVTKVYPGESYAYSESKNGWYKIRLDEGKEGWVIGEYVDKGDLSQLKKNIPDENEQKVLGASAGEENLVVVRPSNLPFVNVYGNPSYAETVIGRVYPGAMYYSFENQNGWFKITLDGGREGWILEEYLRIENRENGNPTNYVNIVPVDGSFINIREEPGVWSGIMRRVYLENRFPALEEKDGWVKIELLDGSQGWVSSQFAK